MTSTKRILKVLCAENTSWTHKIGAWAIKEAENVDFNHFAYMTEFGMIYDAVLPKARKIPVSDWMNDFKIVRTYEIHLDADVYNQFLTYIYDEVGKPYSILQILLIYVSQTLKIAQKKISKESFNGKNALICSEFVARPIMDVLGVSFNIDLDTIGMDELESVLKTIAYRSY